MKNHKIELLGMPVPIRESAEPPINSNGTLRKGFLPWYELLPLDHLYGPKQLTAIFQLKWNITAEIALYIPE